MSSNSETGHAKNVANFEDLISFCTAYGAAYNPVNTNLKLTALQTKNTAAQAALQAVKGAKAAYDNATNAREIAFEPLKKLATRIVNSLAATTASSQTISDAKAINRKIQGRRGSSSEKAAKIAAEKADSPDKEPAEKVISVAQLSFDAQIDHLARLIQLLSTEPAYAPNEADLKITALNALLTSLKSANTSAINALTGFSNSRIARNAMLYTPKTGLTDIAAEVKKYVVSVFGARSPQYRQISGLRFKNTAD